MSTRTASTTDRNSTGTRTTPAARSTGSRTGGSGSRTGGTSSRSSGNGRRRRTNHPEKGGFQVFLELIFLTFFGRVLLVSLAMAAVIGINLLITKNQFDPFFIMTGIELVLLGLFLWLRMMLKKPDTNDS